MKKEILCCKYEDVLNDNNITRAEIFKYDWKSLEIATSVKLGSSDL